jgi:hypothetical protein
LVSQAEIIEALVLGIESLFHWPESPLLSLNLNSTPHGNRERSRTTKDENDGLPKETLKRGVPRLGPPRGKGGGNMSELVFSGQILVPNWPIEQKVAEKD